MSHRSPNHLAQRASAASQPVFHLRGFALAARTLFLLWERPLAAGLLALVAYALAALPHTSLFALSGSAYFNYLADAFLHGQFALRLIPPHIADLVLYNGQYFLYWPPFPAVVLMPFVAVFGVGFSDVAFTLAVGALNVALVAALLRAAHEKLFTITPAQRAALVLFFALGTVHLTLAPRGRVWFTSQLIGLACVLLAYLAVLRLRGWKAFFLAALAMACAAVTRNTMLLAGVWPAWYLLREHRGAGAKRLAAYLAAGAAPLAIIGGLLLAYNWARFGSPTEIGYQYHQMNAFFAADYRTYGAFNLHYLPANFYYQYIFYPLPPREETYLGGSLFLMSPLFLAAFWSLAGRARRADTLALWVSLLLVNIPILLLMGTGWMTYGPRYTLDFYAPLLLLTALGMRRWPRWAVILALTISIATYLAGVLLPFPQ